MATRFEWFRTISENYSRPVLENKKLTLLLWALFLPLAGTQAYSFYNGLTPKEPVVVPEKPDYALKSHRHPASLEAQKNTNSIKKLKILHNIK